MKGSRLAVALGLTLSIPVARPLVLSMGAPELFMLTALGVSYAGSLLGKEVRKGLLSGLLGMLFGLVGPSPAAAQVPAPAVDLLDLDAALSALERIDPRQSRVVELRHFAGLSIEETADVLEVSPSSVKRDWLVAKSWIRRYMSGDAIVP